MSELLIDAIVNGLGQGDLADKLLANDFNTNCLRTWRDFKGRAWMNVVENGKLVAKQMIGNTTATLRREDWLQIDEAIVKVAKPRLKAVADLIGSGNTFTIPNGMGKMVLETTTMSDINDASVSLDAIRDNENDRPVFEPTYLPLPIIHKDFGFSARQLQVSRNGGSPLDTTMAEAAARKVAEEAEKMLIGVSTVADQYTWASGTIYGYTDFPSRLTRTITSPVAGGWTGATLLNDIVLMMQQSRAVFHFGPWKMYVSPDWAPYLAKDYTTGYPKTVQSRIEEVDGITSVKVLDYLTNYDIVLVQMDSDIVREVIGMQLTTIQWDTIGGLYKNFKVMAIMVPQLRADQNSNTGIVHGTV